MYLTIQHNQKLHFPEMDKPWRTAFCPILNLQGCVNMSKPCPFFFIHESVLFVPLPPMLSSYFIYLLSYSNLRIYLINFLSLTFSCNGNLIINRFKLQKKLIIFKLYYYIISYCSTLFYVWYILKQIMYVVKNEYNTFFIYFM